MSALSGYQFLYSKGLKQVSCQFSFYLMKMFNKLYSAKSTISISFLCSTQTVIGHVSLTIPDCKQQ